jgi:hypothetical protein
MLVNMINVLPIISLIMLLASVCTANAGMYKGISSDGEVVYSDVPFRNSEEFNAPPVAVLEMPDVILDKVMSEGAVKAEREAADKVAEEQKEEIERQAEYKYTAFSIVSPKDKQSIWNKPDLDLKLNLKPSLNIVKKHVIWLLLDGEPLVKNSVSVSIPSGRLERGEHKLQAQVRDSKGKLVTKTKTIVVYIHYSSAN